MRAANCLHLVLRPQRSLLKDCLSYCASGDCLVLMDAAVTLMVEPPPDLSFPFEFCSLDPDVRAHGLHTLNSGNSWRVISDSELVERVMRYRHCLSWK